MSSCVYLAGQHREERIARPTAKRIFAALCSTLGEGVAAAYAPDNLPAWVRQMPSPIHVLGGEKALRLWLDAAVHGDQHLLVEEWADKFGGSNFVVPILRQGWGEKRTASFLVVVVNASDHARMCAQHVKKSPVYDAVAYGQNLLTHYDVDEWKSQRRNLLDAVMPISSLQFLSPLMNLQATALVSRLRTSPAHSTFLYASLSPQPCVNLHECLADTAFTILVLGLFGEPDVGFVRRHSVPVRWALQRADPGNVLGAKIVREWCSTMLERMQARAQQKGAHQAAPSGGDLGKCPMHGMGSAGPLQEGLLESAEIHRSKVGKGAKKTQLDNIGILSLAGHDTTTSTMTFLLMELAKAPEWQKRVQREVDQLFASLPADQPHHLTLSHFPSLPLLTQCINETLRLWNAVPYGTMRELQWTDQLSANPSANAVRVPQGTSMLFPNYAAHRNRATWGPDARVWKPERWDGQGFADWGGEEDNKADGAGDQQSKARPFNFEDGEKGCPFAFRNPQSIRFHPFTRAPRDCFGKNFAQMEIRIVVAHLLHNFTFKLAEPTRSVARDRPEALAFQLAGILKPRDGMWVHLEPRVHAVAPADVRASL